jgi:hypothetical protein
VRVAARDPESTPKAAEVVVRTRAPINVRHLHGGDGGGGLDVLAA